MTRRTFLSLPLAALLPSGAAASPAAPARFTIAFVRPEGHLVPIAAYADGRWERAWPQADEVPRNPPTIETTPTIWRRRGERTPETWHVWRSPDAPSLVARVAGLRYVDPHCSTQLVLTTDLPPLPTRTPVHTYPLDVRVAAHTDLPPDVLHLINLVRRSDPRMVEAVHIVNAQLGREGPARIVALYAEADSGRSPMYVLAEHIHTEPDGQADRKCLRSTVLTGWLIPNKFGQLALRGPVVFHSDCDEKSVRTARPLAGIHIGDRRFWVLREFGYEDERSIIAELRPRTIDYVLVINAGGC